jgi:heptosyltransferase III
VNNDLNRLIIRPGAIGDCIVSLPAMEHLRTSRTEVWVTSQNVPLIRFADKVRGIASTGLDLVGLEGLEPPPVLSELSQFDSIVSWYGANRPEFRAAVAHLPFEFHEALPKVSNLHAVDFYLQQVGAQLGATPKIPCKRERRGFVAVHPFSGSPKKNWPLENFLAVTRQLPYPVHYCEGPNSLHIENLYQLGCWLASARFYLGNDSGISHLAAAVGTPVYAFFGPTDPNVWAPRGERVRVLPITSTPDQILDLLLC